MVFCAANQKQGVRSLNLVDWFSDSQILFVLTLQDNSEVYSTASEMDNSAHESVVGAVLRASDKMPVNTETVKGYDFNNGLDYGALLASYKYSGFQATNFGKALEEVNKMVSDYTLGLWVLVFAWLPKARVKRRTSHGPSLIQL